MTIICLTGRICLGLVEENTYRRKNETYTSSKHASRASSMKCPSTQGRPLSLHQISRGPAQKFVHVPSNDSSKPLDWNCHGPGTRHTMISATKPTLPEKHQDPLRFLVCILHASWCGLLTRLTTRTCRNSGVQENIYTLRVGGGEIKAGARARGLPEHAPQSARYSSNDRSSSIVRL